jgi:hypothetical protein
VAASPSGDHLWQRQWRFDFDHKDQRMKPTKVLPFRQCSDISRTERFICIQPLSGYRMIQPEDDGYAIYLAPDASDDALGRALLEALDRSRFIPPPNEPEFFKWERYAQCHRNLAAGLHASL